LAKGIGRVPLAEKKTYLVESLGACAWLSTRNQNTG